MLLLNAKPLITLKIFSFSSNISKGYLNNTFLFQLYLSRLEIEIKYSHFSLNHCMTQVTLSEYDGNIYNVVLCKLCDCRDELCLMTWNFQNLKPRTQLKKFA